jgi:NitT/TauT family transport system substrate-binding protein
MRNTPAFTRLPATAALLLASAAAQAQSGGAAAQAAPDDTLSVYGNTTTIEIAPVLVVADRGLSPGPMTVTNGGIPNLFGVATTSELFSAGTAVLATNAETQALRNSVDNPDLRIILTVSEGLYRLVAKRSSGISQVADLRGKKIGTILNTSSNYFVQAMLASGSLSIDDVEISSVFPLTNYATALTAGGLDAVSVWEPGAEYAAEAIGDDAIEFHDPAVYREIFNLNTRAMHLENPVMRARIVEFVRALIEASELIEDQPAIAWPLVAQSAGLDEELVARVWRHHAYPATLVPDLLDVLVLEEQWLASQAGRTARSRETLATLIDSSVLEEALRER